MTSWANFTGMSTHNLEDIETWFRIAADQTASRFAMLSARTDDARWIGRSADNFRLFVHSELRSAISLVDAAFQQAADLIAGQIEEQRTASMAPPRPVADVRG